jgi:hypothetical protein
MSVYDEPPQTYFSEIKYDEIGTTARERLKTNSLMRTPLFSGEQVDGSISGLTPVVLAPRFLLGRPVLP